MVQHRTHRQVSLVFHSGAATRRNPKNKIIGSILCGAVTRRSVRAKFNTTSRIYLNTLVQATACCWLGSENRDKRASTRPHPSFPRRVTSFTGSNSICILESGYYHFAVCVLKFKIVVFHDRRNYRDNNVCIRGPIFGGLILNVKRDRKVDA